jgi:hypothetical protein
MRRVAGACCDRSRKALSSKSCVVSRLQLKHEHEHEHEHEHAIPPPGARHSRGRVGASAKLAMRGSARIVGIRSDISARLARGKSNGRLGRSRFWSTAQSE